MTHADDGPLTDAPLPLHATYATYRDLLAAVADLPLLEALVRIAIWENDRAVKQALRGERNRDGALWDTCFRHAFQGVLEHRGLFGTTPNPKLGPAHALVAEALGMEASAIAAYGSCLEREIRTREALGAERHEQTDEAARRVVSAGTVANPETATAAASAETPSTWQDVYARFGADGLLRLGFEPAVVAQLAAALEKKP